jgi:divalent metal cation (Fe/Co/Zn/Cd) transporter
MDNEGIIVFLGIVGVAISFCLIYAVFNISSNSTKQLACQRAMAQLLVRIAREKGVDQEQIDKICKDLK